MRDQSTLKVIHAIYGTHCRVARIITINSFITVYSTKLFAGFWQTPPTFGRRGDRGDL